MVAAGSVIFCDSAPADAGACGVAFRVSLASHFALHSDASSGLDAASSAEVTEGESAAQTLRLFDGFEIRLPPESLLARSENW